MPTDSVSSVRNALKPTCEHCGKLHTSECRTKMSACFRCGSVEHFMRNCPRKMGDTDDQSVKPLSTPQKGRLLGQSSNTRVNCSGTKDTIIMSKARVPARSYAIRIREEANAPNVIVSSFFLFDVTVYALIDATSTHSNVCTALVTNTNLLVMSTEFDVKVTNPLGLSVIINLICRKCSL